YLQFYFATLLAGGTVVNINPLYATNELKHIVTDSDPRFVVTLDLKQMIDKIEPLLDGRGLIVASMAKQLTPIKSLAFRALKRRELTRPHVHYLSAEDLLRGEHGFTPVPIDIHRDVAVLQYT